MKLVLAISSLYLVTAAFVKGSLLSEPSSLDLGRSKPGHIVEASARVINNSDVAVDILSIAADCGCTTATMKNHTIAPGFAEEMTVLVSPGTAQGELRRNVTVESTGGNIVIPIKLFVTDNEKWQVEPSVLVLRERTSKTSLRYLGRNSVQLGAATASPDILDIAVNKRGENDYELVFAKKDPKLAEFRSVKVSVATSDKEESAISLVIFIPQGTSGTEAATQQSDSVLRAHPSSINLGSVEVGRSASGQFSLTGWRSATRPTVSVKHGSVVLKEDTGTELRYEIMWAPPIVGYLSNTLSIFDGNTLKLEIPVTVRSIEKSLEH